ncbi:transposase family protein [Streptomyces spectabilis]|uniref:Transposase family protein n=1 Tax=Streptomyces spectabilis TaxID=68270 RepID=A0A516RKA8_STRST|nr:transposase family protein [Streptomyces spectabilis]
MLPSVLALAACGVLAGAKFRTAIAEWAADASEQLLLHCGAALRDPDRPYRAPSEATVRRAPQRIDGDALDAAIGGWLTARAYAARAVGQDTSMPSRPARAALAVDGTSLSGAIRADGRRVHLLFALRGPTCDAARPRSARLTCSRLGANHGKAAIRLRDGGRRTHGRGVQGAGRSQPPTPPGPPPGP